MSTPQYVTVSQHGTNSAKHVGLCSIDLTDTTFLMYNETWTIQKKMEIYSTQDQEKQNIHTTQYMFDTTV